MFSFFFSSFLFDENKKIIIITRQIFYVKFDYEISKIAKKIPRNSKNGKRNFFCILKSFLFFKEPSTKLPLNSFLIQETCILSSKYWNNGIPPTSLSSFVLIKLVLIKKPFAGYTTNYTWRVKKLRVILIFTVVHHWLDKLVSIV